MRPQTFAILKVVRRLALALLLLFIFAAAYGYFSLRDSLPVLEGSHSLVGLKQPVTVQRDSAGVPTLRAKSRVDLARALGYLHAQDRFFQMDLLRRASAGELSALLGSATLKTDLRFRVHRFRSVARAAMEKLPLEQRDLANAYAEGVNAGLAAMRSAPFEYLMLKVTPEPWLPEDSLLVAYTMYLDLQSANGQLQMQRDLLKEVLYEPVYRFVTAGAPEWDSTLDGSRSALPELPKIEDVDLRQQPDLEVRPPLDVLRQLTSIGSNNWAVSGSKTSNGVALVANDMHLGFRVPTIWYRVRMISEDSTAPLDITGVTLPGTPCVVAGSNGHIAWGFTNSYGEYQTLIRLQSVDGHEDQYQTASGVQTLKTYDEVIRVQGSSPVTLRVQESQWGPVVAKDWNGLRMVLDWSAYDPEATNLALLSLEQASSVDQALAAGPSLGIPGQNLTVGDSQGHIGWTIGGHIPTHLPTQGLPQSSTTAGVGLTGWVAAAQTPRIVDPQDGIIWTANTRVLGGSAGEVIGDLDADRGARARQIHDDLLATPKIDPKTSLSIQLDERALFLQRWKELLDRTLTDAALANRPDRLEMREVLKHWSGHAAVDDPAFRLVRRFRQEVEARAFYMMIAPARARAPGFEWVIPARFEGPLWMLIDQKPAHLLATRYASWDAFLLESADAAAKLPSVCKTLATCTWGTVHVTQVRHPLGGVLPGLSGALNMPELSMPGDEDMPRVIGVHAGASERFSVSPGHESEAYFHMPGGESGNPLSPYYREGFEAWVTGKPTAFLPGSAVHTLTLMP